MIFETELDSQLLRVRNLSFLLICFIIYGIYYDITFLKFKPDTLWYFAKTYFILGPYLIIYLKWIPKDLKKLFLGLHWVLYCFYHVYFISLSYYMTFAQSAITFSVMVAFTRKQYVVFASTCFIASAYAILNAQHEMFYVAQGMSAKQEVLINNICFQIVCYFAYYYITLPKLKLTTEEKSFADYGKASSFIMHEMAKPIKRMNQNPENFKEELNRLNEIYTIANSIRSKENQKISTEAINIEEFIQDIIHKYDAYIELYNVHISFQSDIKNVLSDKKLLHFALDNLIRNSIEANINVLNNRFVEIKISDKNISIKNPFYDANFSKDNLFKPMSSTKQGHMGVGLYISKMITDNLGHKLGIDVSRDHFEVIMTVE